MGRNSDWVRTRKRWDRGYPFHISCKSRNSSTTKKKEEIKRWNMGITTNKTKKNQVSYSSTSKIGNHRSTDRIPHSETQSKWCPIGIGYRRTSNWGTSVQKWSIKGGSTITSERTRKLEGRMQEAGWKEAAHTGWSCRLIRRITSCWVWWEGRKSGMPYVWRNL